MTCYRLVEQGERRHDGKTLVCLAPIGREPLNPAAHAVALWCGSQSCGVKNVVATVNHTKGAPAIDIAALRCPSCGGPLAVTAYCQELFLAPVEGPSLAGAKASGWSGWARSATWQAWRRLVSGTSWQETWKLLDRKTAAGDRLVLPAVVDPNRVDGQTEDESDQGKQRGQANGTAKRS
jgi:hypothetical protein